ncbi:hypothetical protein [Aliarcobacter skirrowii]|uniref:hypothetical protein n=1 Tax=Aliarcobacter skirrowii TaxID=28200 RepID=UPI0029A0AECC|nr:hypothetical protein [Aliarcobacter skirrowii]MDX4028315.1 hypothetical protein [Aliarcobacter skirrowii]
MPINERNDTYKHENGLQEKKENSITNSKSLVTKVEQLFKAHPDIKKITLYEPDNTLRINGAPAVKLPNGKLVIAPDLLCELHNGNFFWIEVKDKCQRFYKNDTGADIHQILGFYQIDYCCNQPVLMVFQDSTLERCTVKNASEDLKEKFKKRWQKFGGEPYGNWLRNSLILDTTTKYPMIAKEKSRELDMYIFYFDISVFSKLNSIDLLKELSTLQKVSIKAYEGENLLTFESLMKKSIGGNDDYKCESISSLLPICQSCNKSFTPRTQNAVICIDCWKKQHGYS